jgi:hypothetical protein
MFEEMQRFLWTSNETQLLEWLLQAGDLLEVVGRIGYFVGQPTVGWGTLNEDGSPRPSMQALKAHFSAICGGH